MLFHDLVGAAVDALHAGVDVHLGDRVFEHVAVAAEQLHALVDDLALQVRDPVLGHRGRTVSMRPASMSSMQRSMKMRATSLRS
jgi:hypothetical protein